MSSTIWTQPAVVTNSARLITRLWRAVEAQHRVSTRRLVDSVGEHALLEDILEATKPALLAVERKLHYLLFTPFRYPPREFGSRFRAADDPGVFYGAQTRRTACAELGYWRWRFLTDSAGLTSLGPSPQTLFQVRAKATAIDLERPPFARHAKLWRARNDYTATQRFGKLAREAGMGLIMYGSVRDPEPGRCGAVLMPSAFAPTTPIAPPETWFLTVTQRYATWQRDDDTFEFEMAV